MPIKSELVAAGDVLHQKTRQKCDNTPVTRDVVFEVKIISVLETPDGKVTGFMASWNHNRAEYWSKFRVARLYRSKPKCRPDPFARSQK